MVKPNFFIIGAPKCGTTALSEYLREHPNIYFSNPKEPWYFCSDYYPRQKRSLEGYLSLFKDADPRIHQAIGEGSIAYLISNRAIQEILKFNPEAKFIVMLRNPVELIQSFHAQHIFNGHEDLLDFESAWRAESDRKNGKRIPLTCYDSKILIYSEWGKLGLQMERLFAIVPREKILVIMFEDFIKDTRKSYEQALAFLGMSSDGRNIFPKINENKIAKWPRLHQIFRFVAHVKEKLGIRKKFGLWLKYQKINARPGKRREISPVFKAELQNFFRSDITKLSRLLDRDLSGWYSNISKNEDKC